ncbi:MAG: chemotaxis protein CheD [Methanobacteriota archaeon]|nr:MAG: chemotaxis protein CheD [Euryarchaeota archaeon]
MMNARLIGIAQYGVAEAPETLCCLGLGSCVAVFLHDPVAKKGGVVHVLLPKSPKGHPPDAKYADTGIRLLLEKLVSCGADRNRLQAKLVGGAKMFSDLSLRMSDIGRENVVQSRKTLAELGIRIVAQEIEGTKGRSAYYSTEDGSITVKTAFSNDRRI